MRGSPPDREEVAVMPIAYKVDVLQALKDKGFSSYRLRKEKLMGQRDMQQIRAGLPVSWAVIGLICELLECQPGDILKYEPGEKE